MSRRPKTTAYIYYPVGKLTDPRADHLKSKYPIKKLKPRPSISVWVDGMSEFKCRPGMRPLKLDIFNTTKITMRLPHSRFPQIELEVEPSLGTDLHIRLAWESLRLKLAEISGDSIVTVRLNAGMRPKRRTEVDGRSDDSSEDFWVTGTYDPDSYYSKTRGYSQVEREYIRDAYGDWDTYEANRPY